MTATELKSIRESMNLDIVSMAIVLGWPYRTYQDRELGNRGIPDYAVNQVLLAQQRECEAMTRILGKVSADIDRAFPYGIASEA